MVKKKIRYRPTEKWVKRLYKILQKEIGYKQVPARKVIRLEKEFANGTSVITLPLTPRSTAQAYVSNVLRELKKWGVDTQKELSSSYDAISVVRMEKLSSPSMRNVATVNDALMELAKAQSGLLRCYIDPSYKEFLNELCKQKGFTQGQLIEEMLDFYDLHQ
tara:strand:- start:16 stop:501 length:486 start_codon:yes stop_codon:yes gene_type:complete